VGVERALTDEAPSRRWTPAWIAAVAAAACLAVGLGLWATLGSSDGSLAREPQVATLQGANGTLVVDRLGHAALLLSGLGPAPAGKTYEIWVIPKGGRPGRAGLFARGDHATLERSVAAGATVGVTLERTGGVDTLTRPFRFSAHVPE